MNLSQSPDDFYTGDYYDLISEPQTYPPYYQDTAPTAGASGPSILDQIVSFGKSVIPMALSVKQQNDLNQINVERAKKGLPPLNTSAYAAQSAAQVRVGIAPDTQKMLMYGVAAVLGVSVLMMVLRRR